MTSLAGRWVLLAAVLTTCAATADEQVAATAGGRRRAAVVGKRQAPNEGDFADRSSDGSYAFRYGDRNQFHSAAANKDNVVSGRFGSRSPETGRVVQTAYSAGPRGFRARGPDIARQTDLSQVRLPYSPPVPTDSSKYDPAYDSYFDPNEDPSYKFTVRTPTQSKAESADSRGHVEGVYSYVDDVGKRHDVQYEAGAGTGFHVKSAHPDSDSFGGTFYSGPPGQPGGRPRGHSSVVLGKDGSYGFTAAGPDQRRSEVSDANGRVRGSYTYVDDKGVQRTVQYVAGPEIGYRVVNNAAAGGAATAAVSVPLALSQPPAPALLLATASPLSTLSPSSSLSPAEFEQDLFGPGSSTFATPTTAGGGGGGFSAAGGGGGFSTAGGGGVFSTAGASSTAAPLAQQISDPNRRRESANKGGAPAVTAGDFLSPDSVLPLGSAFPEDDPSLPVKKWPTTFKNRDEQSFFQSFEAFDKRRREQLAAAKLKAQQQQQQQQQQLFGAVPDTPYGGGRPSAGPTGSSYGQQQLLQPFATGGVADASYGGQPFRGPIVVPDDTTYGQYGGTDYQKPPPSASKDHHHHQQQHYHGAADSGSNSNGFTGFPHGTVVKAHVQSLDILPFGYRVPSPSYVLEKQYSNAAADDFVQHNSIKK